MIESSLNGSKLIDNIQLVHKQGELSFNPWDKVVKELDGIVFGNCSKEDKQKAIRILNEVEGKL